MSPLIPYADVTMYGALDPDGEVYKRCRIVMLGKPASVVLYRRLPLTDDWKIVDRLTSGTVIENADGTVTITGISNTLVDEVGIAPQEASVRWEVRPIKCQNCH